MNLIACLKMLRPHQWLKNLMLFFPPFLGGILFSINLASQALLSFVAFCMASSATYILNDLFDKENDRHHPVKRTRPIASGQVSAIAAQLFVAALLICSVLIAWSISSQFLLLLFAYLAVSFAYSAKLKNIVLVDIFCISAGFLLRLQAGGAVFNIPISEWLFLSVFLLSIFLCTGKRLAEKKYLGDAAHHHRKALDVYPKGFLEGSIYMTGGSVLVTYAMYVLLRHSPVLLYTVPLCCFGLLRYILRVQSGKGGDPTESLTRDVPLLMVGLAWVLLVGWGYTVEDSRESMWHAAMVTETRYGVSVCVSGIALYERLRIVFCKYLFFLRDRLSPGINTRHATAFGIRYCYNDRFGLGSIQRVFCSSWKLKGVLPPRPVVVDVGANLGQFNLFSRVYLQAERIISIEPLPSCYPLLTQNAERLCDCINMLVTEQESETRFFVACDSQLSSTVRDDGGEYCGEILVKGMPLGRMLDSAGVDRINLLKIDTEGSEMEVLHSAGELLDKTDVVLVEMSVFRKNRGNIFAVGSFLEARGFRLHDLIFSEGVHPADADGIFIRV